MGAEGGRVAPPPLLPVGPQWRVGSMTSFLYGLCSRCEGVGLVLGWGQDGENSPSAEAGHSEAEFMTFGPAGEAM